MVQRKALPAKAVGDHVRKQQHHDARKAADLKKKKMKKSASIKRSEVEAGNPTRRVREMQPGEPPTPPAAAVFVTAASSPQKQSPVSPAEKTPNYMRSTTSSDARKEQSHPRMSSRSSAPDRAVSHREGSKSSKLKTGPSGNRKAIARTPSSLKTMRTLTKNPSFKVSRASAIRKCSPVVLCENLDSQRATCSSTLKDSKFPAYLHLNPGGTESEGTSAVKVCPYTYCSLNGHRHAPLPPLKCFISARRRMVKAQRGIKIGCLSPRRGKAVGNGLKLDENFMVHVESQSISPPSEDFFVEIFAKDMGDTAGVDGSGNDCSESIHGSNESAAEYKVAWAQEMILDAPICHSVDVDESLDQNGDSCLTGVRSNKNQEDGKPGLYDMDSSVSDMDGETGYGSVLYLDFDAEYSPESGTETNLDDKGCFDELMADEVPQKLFDEESMNSDAISSSNDGGSSGFYDYLLSLKYDPTSADAQIPAEEAEPVPNQGASEVDMSFDEQEPLQNEDGITASGEEKPSFVETGDSTGKGDCGDITDVISVQISLEDCPHVQIELSDSESHGNSVEVGTPRATKVGGNTVVVKDKGKDAHAAKQEAEDSAFLLKTFKSKKPIEESDEEGQFNPRPPNFLPLELDPEGEKIDLRHQELGERRNTEEWMVDYALRQVVAKLGPARKRKVALLVEAFERVTPITKCDFHMNHSPAFGLPSPVQACR